MDPTLLHTLVPSLYGLSSLGMLLVLFLGKRRSRNLLVGAVALVLLGIIPLGSLTELLTTLFTVQR